jgi:outer membrane immunogenic protein
MKRLVLGALLSASLTASAFAADLPVRAPAYKAPVAVATVYNWTGFYIGGHVGYGWGDVDPGTISFFDPDPEGSIAGIKYDIKGVVGGVQGGWNVQTGNIVVGVEFDFSGTGIKGSVTDTSNGYKATSKIEWLTTGRVRLGVAFDRALLFATGGIAAAEVEGKLNDFYPAGTVTTTSNATYIGWTVGGGLEFAIAQNWTVRGEYLFMDFGSRTFKFREGTAGWALISGKADLTASVARLAVNLRF